MLRFPFNSRPMPPRDSRPNQQNDNVKKQDKERVSYEDLLKNASLSPELSFLLAMTLKDGIQRDNVFEMLEKIEPYVSSSDKNAIRSIIGAKQMTENFKHTSPNYCSHNQTGSLSGYSRLSRQQALLDILQKYASSDSSAMMQNLQRSTKMQQDFERMSKQMQKLQNMNNASPEDMFEAISMFMPPEQQSGFRNMQNMMRMMSSMGNMGSNGNMKPEDLFRFMNMNNNNNNN